MTTKKKTGLGRGLNTLIPSAPVKDTESEKILKKRRANKIGDYGTDIEVEPIRISPEDSSMMILFKSWRIRSSSMEFFSR